MVDNDIIPPILSKVFHVKAMIEKIDKCTGQRYFVCGDSVYLHNPHDLRPSRQYRLTTKALKDEIQLTL